MDAQKFKEQVKVIKILRLFKILACDALWNAFHQMDLVAGVSRPLKIDLLIQLTIIKLLLHKIEKTPLIYLAKWTVKILIFTFHFLQNCHLSIETSKQFVFYALIWNFFCFLICKNWVIFILESFLSHFRLNFWPIFEQL